MRRVICSFSAVFVLLPALEGVAVAQQPAPAAAPATGSVPAAESGWSAEQPAPAPAPESPPPAPLPPSPLEPAPPASAGGTGQIAVAQKAPPPPPQPYDGPPLLLSAKKPAIGGYGGPMIAYSYMLHRDGVLFGGEGGLLLDHRLALGLAGYGFSRTPSGPPASDGTPREFATAYGGFLIRYHAFAPNIPVYASLGLLIGGGAIVLAPDHDWDDDWDDDDDIAETSNGYFVMQPDITVHINVTRWLRFGITGGYRFASVVDEGDFDGSALRGAIFGGNIQAGWF